MTDRDALAALVQKYRINTIYHMAAILSATGEEKPRLAWTVNIGGLYNVLEVARELGVQRIYHPSSIAAFGPETPKDDTPARDGTTADDHVRRDEGYRRDARRLLSPALWAGRARDSLPGRDLERDAARRRHDRLRGRHLLRGDPARPLHLLRARRYRAAHDLHARLHTRNAATHGGRCWRS